METKEAPEAPASLRVLRALIVDAYQRGYERGKADGIQAERRSWRELPTDEEADR